MLPVNEVALVTSSVNALLTSTCPSPLSAPLIEGPLPGLAASTFNSVVFPAPFGPTIPTASSAANVKSTSATATKLLKRLVIPAAESKAGFSGTASLRSLDTLSYTESASHRRESRSPRRC